MSRAAADVLLLSTYELGHAPHGLALTAAFLTRAGIASCAQDLAVEPLSEDAVRAARVVAISVPMHTALRTALGVARRVRALQPAVTLAFFGLYAPLHRALLLAEGARIVVGGEHEEALAAAIGATLAGDLPEPCAPDPLFVRLRFPVPDRSGLPPPSRYARLVAGGEERVAGYVEASRGCKHHCRHCPIPAVYGGRFVVVPVETVLSDVAAQVSAGARHITFGDPDFFNGPGHAMSLVRKMRKRFGGISFDFTAKVEHLLRFRTLLPEIAASGCAFVVTAVESFRDEVLTRLHKGHGRQDALALLDAAREAGLTLRPTFVPFTPWSTREEYAELLAILRARGLVGHVDPVQLSIRLLLPPGSLLLEEVRGEPWLGELDPPTLTVRWRHPDPEMDVLHAAVERIVRHAAHAELPDAFARVEELVLGRRLGAPPAEGPEVPRLSEPWFC